MNPVSKFLIFLGVALILSGLAWAVIGRHIPLGRLPGDIVIEGKNSRFYFPIVTCLLISAVLSLISYLFRLFGK